MPRATPTRSRPATPTHGGGRSGGRFCLANRRPGGSACLLVLVAVRIVVGVACSAFLDFSVIENHAEHPRLSLLELALHPPLSRFVLRAGTDHVQNAIS